MERLTDEIAVIEPGTYLVLDDLLDNMPEIQSVSRKELYYRLGLIENALGKNYDLDHLHELVKADREGRCVVLPCKVGDRLYTIRTIQDGSFTLEVYDSGEIRQISVNTNGTFFLVDYGHSLSANNFGKTVFKTREEAEVALKTMAKNKYIEECNLIDAIDWDADKKLWTIDDKKLNDIPAADVVEVVRCQNCAYSHKGCDSDMTKEIWCTYWQKTEGKAWNMMHFDDFCSHGAKMDLED